MSRDAGVITFRLPEALCGDERLRRLGADSALSAYWQAGIFPKSIVVVKCNKRPCSFRRRFTKHFHWELDKKP